MNQKRVRLLKAGPTGPGPVIYWMSRDQRISDNWALIHAQHLALQHKKPLFVVFCLVPQFLRASMRQYGFMLKGLKEVETGLQKKNISFFLLRGLPEAEIIRFTEKQRASVLITDFDPLKIKRRWKEEITKGLSIPFFEVDAHNIVPCWIASHKQEYGAYTLRPKIKRLLPEFMEGFPRIKKHPFSPGKSENTDWGKAKAFLQINSSVFEVSWIEPGEKAAKRMLRSFIKKFSQYDEGRNDPNLNARSGLSPYIHFGHVSAQRAALEIKKSPANHRSKEVFLEELIVRRELSDNYCFYNHHYGSFEGFPDWARKTLDEHRTDRREYTYSSGQLEHAETHDKLWNAAQMQMVKTGKMHGYMRMYWAKKILEWTASPEDAVKTAISLNDRYELDGRDPNGYTGIAWSIGGVHDRPWNEREIFGKIRYMSYNGCRSKFDINRYIQTIKSL
jgi:deoxyribodipyrimidine photo-lyase